MENYSEAVVFAAPTSAQQLEVVTLVVVQHLGLSAGRIFVVRGGVFFQEPGQQFLVMLYLVIHCTISLLSKGLMEIIGHTFAEKTFDFYGDLYAFFFRTNHLFRTNVYLILRLFGFQEVEIVCDRPAIFL